MVAAMAASAQTGEITSNRGENWLSQSGDWGLTFDATPMLNFAGDLFNGTQDNSGASLTNLFSSNNSNGSGVVIGGKKLIDANTAYRGKLRIGFGSTKNTDLVPQIPQPSGATQTATVEDVSKVGFMAIDLGAGLEKRIGSTRVVGIYGGEFGIGFGSGKTTNEYGNAISAENPVSRTTESKEGSTFSLRLQGFAGVEWFCAPKISLSGEYTWGIRMTSTGTTESTTESWNGTAVTTTTVEGDPSVNAEGDPDKTSSFGIDTGVSGASIGLNFYFQ